MGEKYSYGFTEYSEEEHTLYVNRIREELINRKIEYLVHFTRFSNLKSILTHGLVSVHYCERWGIEYNANDLDRKDNCRDAVSLSVSFPNYMLFYKFREKFKNEKWAVILLSTDILLKEPCDYFGSNAASSFYREDISDGFWGYSYTFKDTYKHFKSVFKSNINGITRSDLNIPDFYTTNPQAEILVYGLIPTNYFKAIVFDDINLCNLYNKEYHELIPGIYKPKLFSYREDYKFWQKENW